MLIKRHIVLILLSFFALAGVSLAELRVATLHPLLTDLVNQVGGDQVKITNLMKPGSDVHKFRPKSKDIRGLEQCSLVFAMGKGLESYLSDLKSALPSHLHIVEVGRNIPSQKVSKEDALYVCCPTHSYGAIDPHWWHSAQNMQRAARIVAKELSKADPDNAALYKQNSKQAEKKFIDLHRWAKKEIAAIPKKDRKLVTAHAAFGYFCSTYDFKSSYVSGLSPEHEISSKQLAKQILDLKKTGIKAVFPEQASNPKTLRQIAKETGAKIGQPLIADGSVSSYEKMFVNNIQSIRAALAP